MENKCKFFVNATLENRKIDVDTICMNLYRTFRLDANLWIVVTLVLPKMEKLCDPELADWRSPLSPPLKSTDCNGGDGASDQESGGKGPSGPPVSTL